MVDDRPETKAERFSGATCTKERTGRRESQSDIVGLMRKTEQGKLTPNHMLSASVDGLSELGHGPTDRCIQQSSD